MRLAIEPFDCTPQAAYNFTSPKTDGGKTDMPKFIIEREIPGVENLPDEEVRKIAQKSVKVLTDMGPKIQWLHSYVAGGKIYCVYLAPDEETIREHARRGGFPANRISAVRRLIDPGTAE
jgi:hypothetical protein